MKTNFFKIASQSCRNLPWLIVLCCVPFLAAIAVASPTQTNGVLSLIERRLVDSADWEVIDKQFFSGEELEDSMTYTDTTAEYGVGYVYRHRQMPAKHLTGTIDEASNGESANLEYEIVVPTESLAGAEEPILLRFVGSPDQGAVTVFGKNSDGAGAYKVLFGIDNVSYPEPGSLWSNGLAGAILNIGDQWFIAKVDVSLVGTFGLFNSRADMVVRVFLDDIITGFDHRSDRAGPDIEWEVERINEFDTPSSLITYSQGAYTDRIDVIVEFAAADKYTESYYKSGTTSMLGYRKLPVPLGVQLTEDISHVQISWTPVAGVPKIAIFRSESNTKPSHPMAVVDASSSHRTDTTIMPNTSYYYWLQAVVTDDIIEGANSDSAGPFQAFDEYATPPILTSILINNGDVFSTRRGVEINHTYSDSAGSPTQYRAVEGPPSTPNPQQLLDDSGVQWRPYSSDLFFTLSDTDGSRRIYLQLRNNAGESNILSDAISYLPPIDQTGWEARIYDFS